MDPMMEKFSKAEFVIECTRDEQFLLHKLNTHTKTYRKWEEDLSGFGIQIGEIDNRPIFACIEFATIDGLKVAFVELISLLADYEMLDKWMLEHNKAMFNGRRALTNAMNFFHINTAIQAKAEGKTEVFTRS